MALAGGRMMRFDPERKLPSLKMLLWLAAFIAGLIFTLAQFAPGPARAKLPSATGAVGAAEAYAAIDADNNGYVLTRQEAVGRPHVLKDGTSVVHLRVWMENGEGQALVTVKLHRGWIGDDITARRTK